MRMLLAKAVWVVSMSAGFVAAFAWLHFIASFGWGNTLPHRGVLMWVVLVPAMLAFIVTLFIVSIVLKFLWQAVFREKFPAQ